MTGLGTLAVGLVLGALVVTAIVWLRALSRSLSELADRTAHTETMVHMLDGAHDAHRRTLSRLDRDVEKTMRAAGLQRTKENEML